MTSPQNHFAEEVRAAVEAFKGQMETPHFNNNMPTYVETYAGGTFAAVVEVPKSRRAAFVAYMREAGFKVNNQGKQPRVSR